MFVKRGSTVERKCCTYKSFQCIEHIMICVSGWANDACEMLNSLYVGIYMDVMLARKSILELLRMVWHHFAMLVVERKSIHAFGVASFSGHSQILSRSCGENSGEGLGSLLLKWWTQL